MVNVRRPYTYKLLACLLGLLLCPVSSAFAGGSLINSEVEVDVTATDTADARGQAMIKGQSEALADLLGRFTTGASTRLMTPATRI